MHAARRPRGARTLRLLASAALVAVLLAALPTLARAQTAPDSTTEARLDIDASCSSSVLNIDAAGFQAERTYVVLASPVAGDSGVQLGPEPADEDGRFRLTAPLALFDAACAQHDSWRFVAFEAGAPTSGAALADAEATFGAPSPALAGFGVHREAERTHPAVIIALLTVSAAIIVSTIRHRRGHTSDDFED